MSSPAEIEGIIVIISIAIGIVGPILFFRMMISRLSLKEDKLHMRDRYDLREVYDDLGRKIKLERKDTIDSIIDDSVRLDHEQIRLRKIIADTNAEIRKKAAEYDRQNSMVGIG